MIAAVTGDWKKRIRTVLIVLGFCLLMEGPAVSGGMNRAGEPDLEIFFDTDQSELSKLEKKRLYSWITGIDHEIDESILVVGYTDAVGSEAHNQKLSVQRAESTKLALIRYGKLTPDSIHTVGVGSQWATKSKNDEKKRAKNRRTEIYLHGTARSGLFHLSAVKAHNNEHITALLLAARTDIFNDDWENALLKLDEAKRYGGKKNPDWHVTYGAIGYFSGMPPAEFIPYFETALLLNPYHEKAREFLGRMQARLNVDQKRVGPHMGQTPDNPIKVQSPDQEIEYLKLFRVKAIRQQQIREKAIHIWHGTDQQGKPVTYYFDCSAMNRWAYRNASRKLP